MIFAVKSLVPGKTVILLDGKIYLFLGLGGLSPKETVICTSNIEHPWRHQYLAELDPEQCSAIGKFRDGLAQHAGLCRLANGYERVVMHPGFVYKCVLEHPREIGGKTVEYIDGTCMSISDDDVATVNTNPADDPLNSSEFRSTMFSAVSILSADRDYEQITHVSDDVLRETMKTTYNLPMQPGGVYYPTEMKVSIALLRNIIEDLLFFKHNNNSNNNTEENNG